MDRVCAMVAVIILLAVIPLLKDYSEQFYVISHPTDSTVTRFIGEK